MSIVQRVKAIADEQTKDTIYSLYDVEYIHRQKSHWYSLSTLAVI